MKRIEVKQDSKQIRYDPFSIVK